MKGMRYVHTNMIARDWRAPARFYQTLFGCVPVPPPSKTRFRNWYAVPPPLVQGFRSLRNPLSRRLLKKVQMQGGRTHPAGWVPGAE